MSESAVYQQVVACHGLSPMQMVTQLRMERAKDLLLHSNHTLQAIAEAVGYQTSFAFSDAFLRYTGRRPGRFRRPMTG
jgi:AraC-like DNA-binding protein